MRGRGRVEVAGNVEEEGGGGSVCLPLLYVCFVSEFGHSLYTLNYTLPPTPLILLLLLKDTGSQYQHVP